MDTGDIIWVNFDPAFGHEQAGRRPALVLSNQAYNERASFTIVCPITTSQKPWPFHVPLPAGLHATGFVVVDQVKAIDRRRIVKTPTERIDAESVGRIRDLLALITFGTERQIDFDGPPRSA